MQKYKFSIIIPHINEWYLLDIMLDSMYNQFHYDNYEIIIVDDGSDDTSHLDFIETHFLKDKITLYFEKNLGLARAKNLWAKYAIWEYLIFFDSHMYFRDDFLQKLDHILTQYPGVEVLQPVIWNTKKKWSLAQHYKIKDFLLNSTWQSPILSWDIIETPNIAGGASIIKKEVFERVGGFQPYFIKWWAEDLELSFRLWLWWYKCYFTPNLFVTHYFKDKFTNTEVKSEQVLNNKIMFAYTCIRNLWRRKDIFEALQKYYWAMYDDIHKQVLNNDAFWKWLENQKLNFQYDDDWYFDKFRDFFETSFWNLVQNKEHPKISVLMPVYNWELFLRESIESVLAQTFQDFEFIILDDASNDTSRAIIWEYQKKDPRIKILCNNKNLWISKSRNILLDNAKGKYIAILDHDDIALEHRLQVQFDYLETHRDIFLIWWWTIDIDHRWNEIRRYHPITDSDKLMKMLEENCYIYHPSVMFRNSKNFRYNEEFESAEDYDFYLNLIKNGKKISNIPEMIIKYRRHSSQTSATKHKTMMENSRKIKEVYNQRLSSEEIPQWG